MTRPDLATRLRDRDYREAFLSSTINSTIAYQIRDLRREHDLGQADLGNLTGMKQTAISRLENPDYGNLSVNTLKRIAKAFDVALMVRFIPYSELTRWRLTIGSKEMTPAAFDHDHGFRDNSQDVFSARTSVPLVAVAKAAQRKVGTTQASSTQQLSIEFSTGTARAEFWGDSTPKSIPGAA